MLEYESVAAIPSNVCWVDWWCGLGEMQGAVMEGSEGAVQTYFEVDLVGAHVEAEGFVAVRLC